MEVPLTGWFRRRDSTVNVDYIEVYRGFRKSLQPKSLRYWSLKMGRNRIHLRSYKIIIYSHPTIRSVQKLNKRDSLVTVTLHYWLYDRGVGIWFPATTGFFLSSSYRSDRPRDPLTILFSASRKLFPTGKGFEREADHSPPSGTEVKNAWMHTSAPPFSSWRGA
jgi:hypothetical protein